MDRPASTVPISPSRRCSLLPATPSMCSSRRSWAPCRERSRCARLVHSPTSRMALVKEPAIAGRVQQIVMMGGGFFEGGNTTPAAEFNIYVDPHAAHVVFTSGIPITMMPLDVTHKALATRARVDAFRALGTPAGDTVAGMLDFFDRYDMEKYGIGRCTAPRSDRDRLPARTRPLLGPSLSRCDRSGRSGRRHDPDRLVGCHRQRAQCHGDAWHRHRRLLRFDHGPHRPALASGGRPGRRALDHPR